MVGSDPSKPHSKLAVAVILNDTVDYVLMYLELAFGSEAILQTVLKQGRAIARLLLFQFVPDGSDLGREICHVSGGSRDYLRNQLPAGNADGSDERTDGLREGFGNARRGTDRFDCALPVYIRGSLHFNAHRLRGLLQIAAHGLGLRIELGSLVAHDLIDLFLTGLISNLCFGFFEGC